MLWKVWIARDAVKSQPDRRPILMLEDLAGSEFSRMHDILSTPQDRRHAIDGLDARSAGIVPPYVELTLATYVCSTLRFLAKFKILRRVVRELLVHRLDHVVCQGLGRDRLSRPVTDLDRDLCPND